MLALCKRLLMLALPLIVATPVFALDLSGKTVTITVPFREGGGSDTLARFLQPHLKAALPGNPDVVVLNKPGGGSVTGVNGWVSSAKSDGTDILVGSTSTWVPFAFGAKTVKYNPNDMRAVIGYPRVSVFFTNPETTGVQGTATPKGVAELREIKLIKGSNAPLSLDLGDLTALDMLKIPHLAIFGMSTGDRRKAYLNNETSADSDTFSRYANMTKKEGNRVAPLFVLGGIGTDGKPARIPELPNVPTFAELYEETMGTAPSGPAYKIFQATHYLRTTLAKSILLPEGTSDEVLGSYVAAFRSLENNTEYMDGVKNVIGARSLVYSDDMQAAFAGASGFGAEERTWAETYMKKTHRVTLD